MVTMTEYHKNLPVQGIVFPPQQVTDSLCAVIDAQGIEHLHMAESEKERFVQYYFNGMVEEPYPRQTVKIVSSPRVPTYDKKPEMSVYGLVKELEKQIRKNKFGFVVVNFANPDMVAHSGNLEATIRAIEHVDAALGKVEAMVLKAGGTMIITADHGNAEELKTYEKSGFFYTSDTGGVNTEHSNNPVPVVCVGALWKGKPAELPAGSLADVAPTILHLMGIPVPQGMTGKSLMGMSQE